ncbi:synaptic vesicle glycoprotein 2B-like [Ostrinia furnacalis]|uniref:synaptic vesicle glycoprotein 2B-like n=1 Tax=Ostrinia furnacalis TaxID=93504 RepID=UPI00103CF515|nr:synaptic vesicle glycoprotein 2B-like [Ostrinia furnacalis]
MKDSERSDNSRKESQNGNQSSESKDEKDPMEILEEALDACKFGRFHVRLLFITLAAQCATTMVTTTTSYIMPNAECDLHMNIMQKGLANSMPFFGQVGAALFTGFLIDAFGRKIFLVSGLLGIFVCSIIEGSSQNLWMLIFGKLMEGIFSSFCFTTPAVMVSEMVHRGVRDRVLLLNASFMSLSLILTALMSWAILPHKWDFVLIEGYFVLHSWNFYLYICSIWSLIAGVSYYFLPESPKFLLSHGQENEALDVLKDIYCTNTGKDRDSFPITSLSASGTFTPTTKDTMKKQLTNALFEVKNLFRMPLVGRLFLFSVMTFVCLLAYSSLRLWYPQISTIVENYQREHNQTDWFCEMITDYTDSLHKKEIYMKNASYLETNLTVNKTEICVPQVSGPETYTNGMILGFMSLLGICLSTYAVGIFGHKPLMFALLLFCAACSGSLYWTNTLILIALLISATCGFMQTALSLQQNLLVRVFPTTLRSLSISIIVMVGRMGSLLGSVLFPVMLTAGCMVPFLALSILTFCVAGLVFLLPSPSASSGGDK